MAIITRITRLFKADFNAVLDRIEEPDILLKQAIREMEESLSSGHSRLQRMLDQSSRFRQQITALQQSIAGIESELDMCFDAGEDKLARALVKRKLENQQAQAILKTKLGSSEQHCTELKSRLDQNRVSLASLQQRIETLDLDRGTGSVEGGDAGDTARHLFDFVVGDEQIDIALLREKKLRSDR